MIPKSNDLDRDINVKRWYDDEEKEKGVAGAPPQPAAQQVLVTIGGQQSQLQVQVSISVRNRPVLRDATALQLDIAVKTDQLTSEQLQTSGSLIDAQKQQRIEHTKKNADRTRKIMENEEKAQEAAGKSKVAGWIGTAFGVLGSAIAIGVLIAMSGPAAPLAIAAVAIGTGFTGLELVNQILQEAGVTYKAFDGSGEDKQLDIGITGWIEMGTDDMIAKGTYVVVVQNADGTYHDKKSGAIVMKIDVEAFGSRFKTEEDLQDMKTAISLTLNLLLAALLIGGGVAGMNKAGGAAAKALDTVAKSSQKTQQYAHAMNISVEVVQTGTATSQGILTIEQTELESKSARDRADKERASMLLKMLADQLNMTIEFSGDRMEARSKSTENLADMSAALAEAGDVVVRNFS